MSYCTINAEVNIYSRNHNIGIVIPNQRQLVDHAPTDPFFTKTYLVKSHKWVWEVRVYADLAIDPFIMH